MSGRGRFSSVGTVIIMKETCGAFSVLRVPNHKARTRRPFRRESPCPVHTPESRRRAIEWPVTHAKPLSDIADDDLGELSALTLGGCR